VQQSAGMLPTLFDAYYTAHQPLVITLCALGIPNHVGCIMILSKRRLFNATNCMLISLSASQLMLIVSYLFITVSFAEDSKTGYKKVANLAKVGAQ